VKIVLVKIVLVTLVRKIATVPAILAIYMISKVIYTLTTALLIAFIGWVASTVHAMDKKTEVTEYRLNLIEENHKMLKNIVETLKSQ
jgi:hypothetical protein